MHQTRTILGLASLLVLLASSVAQAQAGAALQAPTLEPPPPGYAPAQQPGWGQTVPQPGTYTDLGAAPRALSPNGPRIVQLREQIRLEREQSDAIDVGWPMGFFVGGLVTTAAGAFTSLMSWTTFSTEMLVGGLVLAGAGMITWIASLIIWRVQARRRQNHERRAVQMESELGQILGTAANGIRF